MLFAGAKYHESCVTSKMPPKKIKKSQFEPRDLVLAKMHGFPAWPSFVMPMDMVPEAILKAKKKTTNYCVIFIPDGDFYWMNDKNLEPLSEEKLDKKLDKIPNKNKPKKKSGGRTLQVTDALWATKGLDFDDFMERLDTDRLQDNEEEEEEDDEQEEGYEDEQEYDDETRDPKVQDENDNKEDEDESQEEANHLSEKNGKSERKRSISSNGKRKTLKTSTPTESTHEDYTNGHAKPKLEGSPKLTEEEKQHQLWLCRIKLQRSLIQRNQPVTPANPKQFPPPTANELLVSRLILHRLVDFPVSLELLKKTKIHKVLKCILRDKDLEYPDSFKLHEKCDELLAKWSPLIDNLKQEKLKESNNNNPSSSTSSALVDVKTNDSRLSSLAPDDSEISALDNVANDAVKKELANGDSKDTEDIGEPVTNNVSVIS